MPVAPADIWIFETATGKIRQLTFSPHPGVDVSTFVRPELVVEGLGEADARELLDATLTGPLDARVRDRIVAEARQQLARAQQARDASVGIAEASLAPKPLALAARIDGVREVNPAALVAK